MDETPASPRLKRIQWVALALLLTAGVVNYIDRATLAVGLPLIRHDLGLSLRQSGYLLSAFLWAYAVFQLPAGALVDRFGARLLLSLGLGLWSFAQIVAGLVTGFWQFIAARILLGVGEAPMFPTSARTVADWYSRPGRGRATGIWNCSSSLGQAISLPLLTILMTALGWRWMFITVGAAGVTLALTAYAVHRNPNEVALTPEEEVYLAEARGDSARITWTDWRRLFAYPTTWGMIIGFFGNCFMSWIYNAWLPQYLEIEWHLSIVHTGWLGAIPYVFGVIGSIAGGGICDLFLRRGFSPVMSRKIPLVISLALAAVCTLLAAATHSSALAITYISGSFFLLYIGSTSTWAMATVATTPRCSASLGAIQNFGGYLGGALAPIATGIIAEATGSFRPALVVGGVVALLAAAAQFLLVRGPVGEAGQVRAV